MPQDQVKRDSKPECPLAMRDLGFIPVVFIDIGAQPGTECANYFYNGSVAGEHDSCQVRGIADKAAMTALARESTVFKVNLRTTQARKQ